MINKIRNSDKKDGLSLYELARLALGLPVYFFPPLTYIKDPYKYIGDRVFRDEFKKQRRFEMRQKYWVISLVFAIGVYFMLSASAIAQGEEGALVEEPAEVRTDKVKTIMQTEGTLNSVLEDKIVITYFPEGQEGTWLQTHYLTDENTAFVNCTEETLNPGDVVEVTYERSRWLNEEGKRRGEQIAKNVRFIRSKEADELRKKGRGDKGIGTEAVEVNPGEVAGEI